MNSKYNIKINSIGNISKSDWEVEVLPQKGDYLHLDGKYWEVLAIVHEYGTVLGDFKANVVIHVGRPLSQLTL